MKRARRHPGEPKSQVVEVIEALTALIDRLEQEASS